MSNIQFLITKHYACLKLIQAINEFNLILRPFKLLEKEK